MPRSRRSTDAGSASLEFVTLGVLLLVPLVYLVVALAAIQAAALAAEGAARQAARVFVTAPDATTAAARAARALDVALADHAVDPGAAGITISCTTPTDCLDRRGFVTVTVDVLVPLPLLPTVLPGGLPLAVPVQAAATQQVSRFGGAG